MARNAVLRVTVLTVLTVLCVAWVARAEKVQPEITEYLKAHPELVEPASSPGGAKTAAIPDIFGPGAVLNVGNLVMKITNNGIIGNPLTNISSDPSAQWPGTSAVEYANFIILAVAGVNPTATDPAAVRRVSFGQEWWPPTADPEDRMYRAYDGIIKGARFLNDDSDFDLFTGEPNIDEDFLDGRDNDGDGKIDEDYAALGQQMYTCVMRDDTPAALAFVGLERHIPLVLEVRQAAWAYSVPGFTDFNAIEYTVINRSGHTLDSLYFGFRVDMDCGPLSKSDYFNDDVDMPYAPSGEFALKLTSEDPRFQLTLLPNGASDTLCPQVNVRVQGFSVGDNDGDEGKTAGIGSFLLLGHTTDPLGVKAPSRTSFRAFRSFIAGTPYTSNGNPIIDQQRIEFLRSSQNISAETGLIEVEPGDQDGDYTSWASVGPFLSVPDGGSFQATCAFAVQAGDRKTLEQYREDYTRYKLGLMSLSDLFDKYPIVENAFAAQVAFEGVYEAPRPGFEDRVPDCHGCESSVKLPRGTPPTFMAELCPDRESVQKLVTDNKYTWFDFDCDPCTGVWDEVINQGYFLKHWNAESPPPSPNLNVASTYNYTDNPGRVISTGDNAITLAWDNASETTPDPKSQEFDFRAYKVWKVASWQRPVGASGPNDEDWALLSDFRFFDYRDSNFTHDPVTDTLVCPRLFVPNWEYPAGHPHCSSATVSGTRIQLASGGCRDTATVSICLRKGDLWDHQSGVVARPDASLDCIRSGGECVQDSGKIVGKTTFVKRTRYPVGRYRMVDREVKNGFVYFYSVTASDSSASGVELAGRRTAVEADLVTPQAGVRKGKAVWVVPNPYRGFRNIDERSSAWDLIPNASDPTGTHIDFMGMPPGEWTIRIFTVSGDLVVELRNSDPVNESVRGPVTGEDGQVRQGVNRQQDHPNDGQARWNLISRNGQDVVSGIYLFVVNSGEGQQRGKFVVIR